MAAALIRVSLIAMLVVGDRSDGDSRARVARDGAIEAAVRAAILTDKTIVVMPTSDIPGRVTDETVAALRKRLAEQLPRVYAGPLLVLKLGRLDEYLDAARSNPSLGQNTAAGITTLGIEHVEASGTHAVVSGSYRVWVTGRHLEGGAVVPDRVEGSYWFQAGLDEITGHWLASSWTDQQLS